jgi:hypothetical protein
VAVVVERGYRAPGGGFGVGLLLVGGREWTRERGAEEDRGRGCGGVRGGAEREP